MTQNDLSQFRQLAKNGQISYSGHALQRMLERGISLNIVEDILRSDSNQILETQSPSLTPGMEHPNERILIYDPYSCADVIVLCVILFVPLPEISVITAMYVQDEKWERVSGNPALVRKP